jgi:hypothetical protein
MVMNKGRFLVIYGDWNINLLHENIHQKAFIKFVVEQCIEYGGMSNESHNKLKLSH